MKSKASIKFLQDRTKSKGVTSLPARERGLKLRKLIIGLPSVEVALCVVINISLVAILQIKSLIP